MCHLSETKNAHEALEDARAGRTRGGGTALAVAKAFSVIGKIRQRGIAVNFFRAEKPGFLAGDSRSLGADLGRENPREARR